MTKRVAFLAANTAVPWGGSEELWYQTATRMVKAGYDIAASVEGWEPAVSQIEALRRAGADVHYRWYNRTIYHLLQFKLSKGSIHQRWLNRFSPDLAVISQASNIDGVEWMEACIARNIPFVTIAQAAAPNYWPSDDIAARLAAAFQQSAGSFFVSQRNIDLTATQIAADIPKAKVVRNPFNVSYNAAPTWPEPAEPLKLACVGRLEPTSKGQDILFEVISAQKWRERPLQVTLYGKGLCQESLVRLKSMWKLDNVQFGSYVNNIEAVWEAHHGLILPSRYEGLPLAVVEAMLCARLCIVTDVAGNRELVEDNINGFIAAAPKVEFLDEALERAWQQRSRWYEMGQAAAKKVRACVPRDPIGAFVQQLEELIKP